MSEADPSRPDRDPSRGLDFLQAKQEQLLGALRKRDGIIWRLDQIPERALAREGEERQKLLDRAGVLEAELIDAIVEAETVRMELIRSEIDVRIERLRQEHGETNQALIDEYEQRIRSIGAPSAMDPLRMASGIVEAKRAYRESVLRGENEPDAAFVDADARVRREIAAFEDEQRQRIEATQEYEGRLRRPTHPAKGQKRR
ncbi:MAG TPA: hypothetical protein VGE01_02845 [Fimbriimonas sp.]